MGAVATDTKPFTPLLKPMLTGWPVATVVRDFPGPMTLKYGAILRMVAGRTQAVNMAFSLGGVCLH